MSKVELVELKCGNGCCPDAIFDEDKIVLTEHGQTVTLNKSSLEKLIEESRKRGFIK